MTRGLEVARWLMATLPSPSDTSQPLVLTDAQIDFLVTFYATEGTRDRYRRTARQAVHDVVADLFTRFDVARMYADPFYWHDELDGWARAYGETIVLAHPTNSQRRFGPAVDRFRAAVAEGCVSHDGDPDLARHLANARLVRGPGRAADDGHALFTIEKAGRGRLIDAAVATILAYAALAEADAVEPPPEREILIAWA